MSSSLLTGALWLTVAVLPLVWASWAIRRLSFERAARVIVPVAGIVVGVAYNAMYQVAMLVLESARALSLSEGSVSQLPAVSRFGAVASLLVVAWFGRSGPTPKLWRVPMAAGAAGLVAFLFAPDLWVLWLSGFLAAGSFAAATPLMALILSRLRAALGDEKADGVHGSIDHASVFAMAFALLLTGVGADPHFDHVRVASVPAGLLPVLLGAWVLVAGLMVLPKILDRLKAQKSSEGPTPSEEQAKPQGRLSPDDRRSLVRTIGLACLQIMAFSPLDGPLTIVLANHGLGSIWAGVAMLSMLLSGLPMKWWSGFVRKDVVRSERWTTCMVLGGLAVWALSRFLAPFVGGWVANAGLAIAYPTMEVGTTLNWYAGMQVVLRSSTPKAVAALFGAGRLFLSAVVLYGADRLLAPSHEWWLIAYCALFAVPAIVWAHLRVGPKRVASA